MSAAAACTQLKAALAPFGFLALKPLPVAAHASSMLAEARAATLQQMASTPANALPQI